MKAPFKVGDKVKRIDFFGSNWDKVCSEKKLQPDAVLTIKSIGGYYNPDCLHFEEVDCGWSWSCFVLVKH